MPRGGLAADLFASGDYGAARPIYEDMLKTAKEVGDQKNTAIALKNIGVILFEQGDLANARKKIEESLKITRDTGMKADSASDLIALGDIDLAQDHLEKADKNYHDSFQVSTQLADALGLAQSNSALASLALAQNQPVEAESRARGGGRRIQGTEERGFRNRCAGHAHSSPLSPKINFPEARATLDRAKTLPSQDLGIRLKLGIADAYVSAREGKASDAARILTETIQKTIDLKLKRVELEARFAKAELDSRAEPTPATKSEAKRLQTDATISGFSLIARRGRIAHEISS